MVSILYYNPKETGKRIRELRVESELTLSQLGEMIGLTDKHLQRIETGERNATLDTLVDLAYRFDVSLDYLVLGRCRESMMKKRIHEMADELLKLSEKL